MSAQPVPWATTAPGSPERADLLREEEEYMLHLNEESIRAWQQIDRQPGETA